MVRLHNSESAAQIVLQFCIVKGAKRPMEILLMAFLKRILFGGNGSFWHKNCPSSTKDLLSDFSFILDNKRDQEVMKILFLKR